MVVVVHHLTKVTDNKVVVDLTTLQEVVETVNMVQTFLGLVF